MTSTLAPPAAQTGWRPATVARVGQETSTAWTVVLDVPEWPGHHPGQYIDVRVASPDGSLPKRTFSISSAPQTPQLSLTIERLRNGEVSPQLCDEVHQGDRVEVRGPTGSFTWEVRDGGPLMLIAAGSGIAPLMAMLRYRARALPDAATRRTLPARLLYSSRRWNDVIYRDELARMAADDDSLQVTHTITREPPTDWAGLTRRIDRAMLAEAVWPPSDHPRVYVCGPNPFVASVTGDLAALGHDPSLIRTERFGPTG